MRDFIIIFKRLNIKSEYWFFTFLTLYYNIHFSFLNEKSNVTNVFLSY